MKAAATDSGGSHSLHATVSPVIGFLQLLQDLTGTCSSVSFLSCRHASKPRDGELSMGDRVGVHVHQLQKVREVVEEEVEEGEVGNKKRGDEVQEEQVDEVEEDKVEFGGDEVMDNDSGLGFDPSDRVEGEGLSVGGGAFRDSL